MKKTISLSSLAIGLLLAGSANAASNLTGVLSDASSITPIVCTLLSSDVAIKMSKNSAGSYACSEGQNAMYASVCNSSGATKTRTESCSWITVADPAGGPDTYTPNYTECGTTPPNPIPNPAPTASVTGRVSFAGTSSGGKVASYSIGTTCDAAAARSITIWPTD